MYTVLLTSVLVVVAMVVGLWLSLTAADWYFAKQARTGDEHQQFRRQITKFLILAVGVVLMLLLLPISETTRGQLLSLLGLVVSAIIALSSTSFVANAMAGVMMRSMNNFRPGDFIRAGEQFGRVTERGLFHTEIQTVDRDLTTIPNLVLVTTPITVVHAEGTIVSASVSLGYDVHHAHARQALLAATERAELSEGFVRIHDLLDHAIVYQVSGFLAESKKILLTRSRLREAMLDCLHEADIEIASPGFLNYRELNREPVMPDAAPKNLPTETDKAPDDLIFDKAESAARVEDIRAAHLAVLEQIKTAEAGGEDDSKLEKLRRREERLSRLLKEKSAKPGD